MARIAVAGFQHETNTFAPSPATYADFVRADAWPGLVRGAELLGAFAGFNLPMAGFLEAMAASGNELVPLLWCAALPSASVTEEAYERVAGALMEDLAASLPLDAVYLDLHGAMVAEHLEDGEGELLARVRGVVGEEVPLVASLDLHANVTEAMVAHATALIAYRTYPHIDMAETGARAARYLACLLAGAPAPAKAFRKLPFLIPLTWQCTTEEPGRSLFTRLAALEANTGATLSFTPGFAPADIRECGPAVLAYAKQADDAEAAAEAMAAAVLAAEPDFAGTLLDPDEAVLRAMASTAEGPVVLADTQDNPGAGANGDTVGLLAALIRHDAQGAVLGILRDAESAAQAHAAGPGNHIDAALGAKSGLPGHAPLRLRAQVEALSEGRCLGTGPFYGGSHINLGLTAVLRIGGVRVVVSSAKLQAADQALFRHIGIEPAAQRILALKSSVHFRADFQPLASEILIVAAPGPNPADHTEFPYRRLRPGLRLMPSR